MNVLTVTADDFGLHPDINRGILECAREGVLGAVSVTVNGSAPDWPTAHEMRKTGIRIGIHLSFVGEPWLTDGRRIADWRLFALSLLAGGRGFRRAVDLEARAQLKLMADRGIVPDHLDSHQHVHVLPGIWPSVRDLALEKGISRVRIPLAPPGARSCRGPGFMALQRLAGRRAVARGDAPWCLGLSNSGRNSREQVISELGQCRGHDAEFVAHPGVTTPELEDRYKWGYDWSGERDMLLNPEFKRAVGEAGYSLSAAR
jgi:predicted glycoside hydrolase/deacetylase ChbG (UPF0249 family)